MCIMINLDAYYSIMLVVRRVKVASYGFIQKLPKRRICSISIIIINYYIINMCSKYYTNFELTNTERWYKY